MSKERLPLQTAFNARTLGGYAGKHGRTTCDTFIRSDCFIPMSREDINTLLDMDLRMVVDLRSETEMRRVPSGFASVQNVTYIHQPLMNARQMKQADTFEQTYTFLMGDMYIDILNHSQSAVRALFEAMAACKQGKVMFHCSAGKDRTGITAALLLLLAEVNANTVVEDYALTDTFLAPIKDRLRASLPLAIPKAAVDEALSSRADNMRQAIRHMDQQFGGARGYLEQIGIDPQAIDFLIKRMFES